MTLPIRGSYLPSPTQGIYGQPPMTNINLFQNTKEKFNNLHYFYLKKFNLVKPLKILLNHIF